MIAYFAMRAVGECHDAWRSTQGLRYSQASQALAAFNFIPAHNECIAVQVYRCPQWASRFSIEIDCV
jgi:hypothetical protein